jgi:exopolysaccharide biosynthesis polyprenyl glycosylphosphotransferase
VLKSYRRQFNIWCVLADCGSTFLAFFSAYGLRVWLLPAHFPSLGERTLFGWQLYLPVFFLCAFAAIASFFALGAYRLPPGRSWADILLGNVRAMLLALVLVLAFAAALRLIYLSRLFVVLFLASFLLFSTVAKIVVSRWFRAAARTGRYSRMLLLVGADAQARQIAEAFLRNQELGISVRGFLCPDKGGDEADVEQIEKLGLPRLGYASDLPRLLQREVIDGVLFAAESRAMDRKLFEELCIICEDSGVDVLLPVNPFPHLIAKCGLERMEDISLLHFTTISHNAVALFIKRALDAIGAFLGLLLLAPFLLIVAALVKLTSPGPVFFTQERVGLRGRRFKLAKFRTMQADAEQKLEELREMNEADGPVFKIKNDPRVTPLGRFLRRSSIDELPQLWNVLKGEMSLVGPRPPIPSEVVKYEIWQRRRLSMRPGLTCLWQVSGRSELGFDQWMKLDLQYIDNWSLGLDLLILLKTIPAVLTGKGAA